MFPYTLALMFYCFIATTSCVAVAIYVCFSTCASIYSSPDFLLFHWYCLMCCSSYLYMFHYMCLHILQARFPNVGPSCFLVVCRLHTWTTLTYLLTGLLTRSIILSHAFAMSPTTTLNSLKVLTGVGCSLMHMGGNL